MRKLVILRGAMGSGKSTFIKNNDLENFTLCADNIRLMYNSPEMSITYKEEIPQFNNKKVWNLLYEILEERMKKGEFTIIDAVHAYADESLKVYKKLAEKYRYRLYILDFTNIEIDKIYKRNQARPDYKIVKNSSIDRVVKVLKKEKIPSAFKIIMPDDFCDIIKNIPRNLDNYNKIHIIGDIHGSYSVLKKYFEENPIDENDAYIFLGDYFDRGIENYNTFRFLEKLQKMKNMTFLLGNHEDKLYKYACDDEYKLDLDIKKTIEEFEKNTLKKSEIRGFIKNLSQISYISFANKTYLINHGGIPYIPKHSLDFYSTNSFIYGIGDYETNIDEIYNNFMKAQENKVYQIHGHRNFNKIKTDEYEYSFNLDGNVENGEYLRILTLNKDGSYKCDYIKNDIYNKDLKEETTVYDLIENFEKNKYVYSKDLGNDIYSYNFTKEAFYNKVWDNMTTKARGLFINTKDYHIVARSYNKFFKIDERKETSLEKVKENINYHVKFYLKYNGFLGILSHFNNELFFASKSTNTGEYVEYFKNIFYKKFDDNQIEAIKRKIIDENLTFVFEVIDSLNDPHIIKYENDEIVLLDAIKNSINFEKISYDELSTFSKKYDINCKKCVYNAETPDEFDKIYTEITLDDYKYDGEYIEGFVIEDGNNFMVKTKSKYYDKWKYLRSRMESALKNNDFKPKTDDITEIEFLKYLENKYKDKNIDFKSLNIINERDEFISIYF